MLREVRWQVICRSTIRPFQNLFRPHRGRFVDNRSNLDTGLVVGSIYMQVSLIRVHLSSLTCRTHPRPIYSEMMGTNWKFCSSQNICASSTADEVASAIGLFFARLTDISLLLLGDAFKLAKTLIIFGRRLAALKIASAFRKIFARLPKQLILQQNPMLRLLLIDVQLIQVNCGGLHLYFIFICN